MAISPTLSTSSSDISALSDVPEHIDKDQSAVGVIIEQTVVGEVRVTLTEEPQTVKRGKKRAAEENSAPAKKIRRKAEKTTPELKEELVDVEGDILPVKPAPKKRNKVRKGEINGDSALNVSIEAKADLDAPTTNGTPKRNRRRAKAKEEAKPDPDAEQAEEAATPKERKRKKKVKPEEPEVDGQQGEEEPVVKKIKRKRKTKEEKEAEAMPLAARTIGCKMFIGAHVSAAGGVHNAVTNCVQIGGNAFALFLKSQRKWENPAIKDDHLTQFHSHCTTHSYDSAQHILPHGSYLVNLAQQDSTRHNQAYAGFLDDLQRCESLGIKLFNFHPGSAVSSSRPEAIARIAESLNRAHSETKFVITLLETMARRDSNCIGSTFEDLHDIIALVENKARVGVCFDSCHSFAAGYDLRSPAAFQDTMRTFDEVIGMKYLKALHLNDSKAPLASGRDLHANIGTGFLGLRAFHNIMNEPRFWGLPMLLETPIDVRDDEGNLVKDEKGKNIEDKGIWAREIKMLESFIGMDVEDERFLEMEAKLARKGEGERKRIEGQVERRKEKIERKMVGKGRRRRKKGGEGEDSGKGEAVGDGGESESELSSLGSSAEDSAA